jgi:hypothetical protein
MGARNGGNRTKLTSTTEGIKAVVTRRRANDILRACNLVALPLDDAGVRRDLLNAVCGERLSPVLVVSTGDGCDIAEGYHRVSLAYHLDPFGDVPLPIGAAPA